MEIPGRGWGDGSEGGPGARGGVCAEAAEGGRGEQRLRWRSGGCPQEDVEERARLVDPHAQDPPPPPGQLHSEAWGDPLRHPRSGRI